MAESLPDLFNAVGGWLESRGYFGARYHPAAEWPGHPNHPPLTGDVVAVIDINCCGDFMALYEEPVAPPDQGWMMDGEHDFWSLYALCENLGYFPSPGLHGIVTIMTLVAWEAMCDAHMAQAEAEGWDVPGDEDRIPF